MSPPGGNTVEGLPPAFNYEASDAPIETFWASLKVPAKVADSFEGFERFLNSFILHIFLLLAFRLFDFLHSKRFFGSAAAVVFYCCHCN